MAALLTSLLIKQTINKVLVEHPILLIKTRLKAMGLGLFGGPFTLHK
jgi:hypothetical protein